MTISHFLFLAQAQGKAQPSILGSPFLLMGLMFIMMWVLIIRPQQRQKKELLARINSLEKGDKVITTSGMHASVHHVSENTVTLKISEGIFVPHEKASVQTVIKAKRNADKIEEAEVVSSGKNKKS